ncbi:hypothetical protein KM903_04700 [Bacillus glycinifermentans]|uniref:hypothetical protein n=1 Tax=Bacillus TaxID=1386 RepID=UPI001581C2B2|nr:MULTISPECIES: hypothetical protein [Bacillus]MBU8785711.1 hypothetical protein [Bacillus glycinifermentans]MEC0777474.1 hypothetical protein [Bacillus licheniformis]MEC1851448.1 hypothetical protein [Bacillus licheniformis]MEC3606686.1 hypothetical protein [Bacillus glycinifermentans]NUJ16240.1 hypothetical protein [Bacillus glycinifermentans]
MFKQRLIVVLVYLAFYTTLVAMTLGGLFLFLWISGFPIINITFKVLIVFAGLIVVVFLLIEFINWLFIEPYREHKRVQRDVEEDTQ